MSSAARPPRRQPKPAEKFRLVVSSAEEAVKVIREKFGENARVLEVNQVGGKGLARFLSAPQLEVIGTVISAEDAEREKAQRAAATRPAAPVTPAPAIAVSEAPALPESPESDPAPVAESPAVEQAPAPTPAPAARPGRPNAPTTAVRPGRPGARPAAVRPGRPGAPAAPAAPAPAAPAETPPAAAVRPAARPAPAAPTTATPVAPVAPAAPDARIRKEDTPLTPSGRETLDTLLHKAHFDSDLIQRFANASDWDRVSKMQLNHGISEVYMWLRQEYQKLPQVPLAPRMAFMGTPGCGKTTALCKRMANDVFVHGKKIQVLKVEGESPNPDEALRVLCDILGVSFFRDPYDLDKVDPNGFLYVDVPGISLHEHEQWQGLKARLDQLYVETRVMVVNAAYEKDTMKETLKLADGIGATHQVFTHLDELSNATKLWQFVLSERLNTLFFSYGQNVTGEFSNNVLEFLTSKTFPSYLTR